MHHLIVDLEATCCNQGSFPREEMEIIEIGAVMVSPRFEIVDEFQTFIRPVRHPTLSAFCVELTTIQQGDVDAAPAFNPAMARFADWAQGFEPYELCSWGAYDRKQFQQDCDFHGIPFPISGEHRNLKAEFSRRMNTQKRFGMGGAMRKLGLELLGTHHRGIDDARNIARIFQEIESR